MGRGTLGEVRDGTGTFRQSGTGRNTLPDFRDGSVAFP